MITFEEVSKTVVDLVIEIKRLQDENKMLKEFIGKVKAAKNVREPDAKIKE